MRRCPPSPVQRPAHSSARSTLTAACASSSRLRARSCPTARASRVRPPACALLLERIHRLVATLRARRLEPVARRDWLFARPAVRSGNPPARPRPTPSSTACSVDDPLPPRWRRAAHRVERLRRRSRAAHRRRQPDQRRLHRVREQPIVQPVRQPLVLAAHQQRRVAQRLDTTWPPAAACSSALLQVARATAVDGERWAGGDRLDAADGGRAGELRRRVGVRRRRRQSRGWTSKRERARRAGGGRPHRRPSGVARARRASARRRDNFVAGCLAAAAATPSCDGGAAGSSSGRGFGPRCGHRMNEWRPAAARGRRRREPGRRRG